MAPKSALKLDLSVPNLGFSIEDQNKRETKCISQKGRSILKIFLPPRFNRKSQIWFTRKGLA